MINSYFLYSGSQSVKLKPHSECCEVLLFFKRYFASAFKIFKRLLQHPERLEEGPETIALDIE